MKPWIVVLLVLAVLLIAGAIYGTAQLRRGFSARAEPSSFESFLATTARRWAIPSSYRQLRDPLRASPENVRAGREHFADHCAICHANDGSGKTTFGSAMYPKPPDMRSPETQNKADGELYYTIENGVPLSGMPAFGDHPSITDEDTWRLVIFIRHLPALAPGELQEMESLNPKTEQDRQEEKEEEEFLGGQNPQPAGNGSHHH